MRVRKWGLEVAGIVKGFFGFGQVLFADSDSFYGLGLRVGINAMYFVGFLLLLAVNQGLLNPPYTRAETNRPSSRRSHQKFSQLVASFH
jgi:hypothetical protein